ncbi:MAG: OmpA family protein, partial [Deltaproteobacteria bacterium]|nr:OmpA family protein [Deltaproteobacteria bacterium]
MHTIPTTTGFPRLLAGVWILLPFVALSGPAFAQGIDAHGFYTVPHDGDIRDPLTFYRPGALHGGEWSISALLEYARAPLVQLIEPELSSGSTEVPVLDDVLALNIAAGIAPHERFRLDAFVPVYGFTTAGVDREIEGPTVGDVRVSALGLLVRPDHILDGGGLGVGVEAHVDIPSGNEDRYLGRDGVGGGGGVNATYEVDFFTVSAALGAQFDPAVNVDNLTGSDSLQGGLGVGFALHETTGINLEVNGASALKANEEKGTGSPAQALLSLKYRAASGLHLTFGGAIGMSRGIGSARYRAFLGLGYGNMPPRRESDHDALGTLRIADECPGEMETFNDWKDDDGCADALGSLMVRVQRDGVQEAGAEVSIQSPDRTHFYHSQEMPEEVRDILPETTFTGSATKGTCLSGTGSVMAQEGEVSLLIALQPQLPADIEVRVWDPDGVPIPTGRVFWRAADRACVPDGTLEVNEEGGVVVKMGVGDASLLVSAPEYLSHEQDFTFAAGDQRVLNITLQPKKKKVTRVRLEKKQIVILDKVHFETAKAIIRPESFDLLNDVADTIVTNPDVGRVEVAGHTDARGSETYNQDLS